MIKGTVGGPESVALLAVRDLCMFRRKERTSPHCVLQPPAPTCTEYMCVALVREETLCRAQSVSPYIGKCTFPWFHKYFFSSLACLALTVSCAFIDFVQFFPGGFSFY